MELFRTIARAISSGGAFLLGLWGVSVNNEFFYVFCAVVAFSFVSLVFTIYDDRKARIREKEIDKLIDLMRLRETPLGAQNLRDLSSKTFKRIAHERIAAARAIDAELVQRTDVMPHKYRSIQIEAELHNQAMFADKQRRERVQERFASDHLGDLQAIWQEASRRADNAEEDGRALAITRGFFAGPNPIQTALQALEERIRVLKDD